jgi:hypothetical protein
LSLFRTTPTRKPTLTSATNKPLIVKASKLIVLPPILTTAPGATGVQLGAQLGCYCATACAPPGHSGGLAASACATIDPGSTVTGGIGHRYHGPNCIILGTNAPGISLYTYIVTFCYDNCCRYATSHWRIDPAKINRLYSATSTRNRWIQRDERRVCHPCPGRR